MARHIVAVVKFMRMFNFYAFMTFKGCSAQKATYCHSDIQQTWINYISKNPIKLQLLLCLINYIFQYLSIKL